MKLDGGWDLSTFADFGRKFGQTYALRFALAPRTLTIASMAEEDLDLVDAERAFYAYPWRGGYSVVGFYNVLQRDVPEEFRPGIHGIELHSPGYISLNVSLTAARNVAITVAAIAGAIFSASTAYNEIYKGALERELLKTEIRIEEAELTQNQIKFLEEATPTLAEIMAFEDLDTLRAYSPNQLAELKILMAEFRRNRVLAEMTQSGLIELPTD